MNSLDFPLDACDVVRLPLAMLEDLGNQPGSSGRCTIQFPRSHRFCDGPAIRAFHFPICAKHAIKIYAELASLVEANEDNDIVRIMMVMEELDRPSKPRKRSLRVAPPISGEPVVYYLMVDGLVKIGTTRSLPQRLKAYPPSSHLLATELGDDSVERLRHSEFAEYLSHGREWFAPGPRLREHIEALPTYQAA